MDFEERGYLSDPEKLVFTSRIRKTEDAGDGKSRVWLEATWFYPESGGQPDDRGTLGGLDVVGVTEDDGGVCHLVRGSLEVGAEVEGRIDTGRRRYHMRQHSGQHLLSRVFLEEAGMATVGFHLGERSVTIDLDSENVPEELLDGVELKVNELVLQDIPISGRVVSREEYERISPEDSGDKDMRSRLPEGAEKVRIVEIEGTDSSTCCGTHCRSTGGIGVVKILGTEKVRSQTRVEFICGLRALEDYRAKHRLARNLGLHFSTDWSEVEGSVERLGEENRALKKENAALSKELASYRAGELSEPTESIGDCGLVIKVFEEGDPAAIRDMAGRIREEGKRVVLFGTKSPSPGLVFSCTPGIGLNMGEIMREAAGVIGARGGGGVDFAQGGGGEASRIGEALERAAAIVREKLG